MYTRPTVLILGGCGFIGLTLAEHLLPRGWRVRIFDRPERVEKAPIEHPSLEYIGGDFSSIGTDGRVWGGVEAVLHLIHTTHPASSMRNMVYDISSNVVPSVQLLDTMVSLKIKRLVFLSSGGAVYGAGRSLPAKETDPTDPLSSYGITKLTTEKYIQLYSSQKGLEGINLRLSNPYGPRQLLGTTIGAIATFVRHAVAGRPIEIWGDGAIVRDYIFASDMCRAVEGVLEKPNLRSGVYNLGSEEGYSLNDLIETIRQVGGISPVVHYSSPRSFDVPEIRLDIEKLRREIGFRPRVELEAGVSIMLERARQLRRDLL